ncbi:MAG: hypothetical protein AB1644_01600 [Candidatus Zixiibacteriota bacterium]
MLVGSTLGADNAATRVAFLQIHVDSSGVRLESAKVVKGAFKQPRGESNRSGILYEVVLDDGSVLTSGIVADPLIKRFEYEDPDQPSRLRSKVVALDEAVFTVRIPYNDAVDQVVFSRVALSTDVSRKQVVRRLGAIRLDDLHGDK